MSQPFSLDEPAEAQAPAKAPLLPVRIVQVFTSPAKLFDALRDRPAWIDAMLVLIGISLATQLLIPEEIRRQIVEQSMEAFLPASMTQAEVDAQIDAVMDQPPIQMVIQVVVGTPVMIAIIAGLLLLAFNVVMGGEARFKQLFSATTHAFYVYLLGGMLVLGLMFMGSEQMMLTPGLFLPETADGFFARVLNGINVFSVWTCVVLGIAVSRIYPKRTVGAGTWYMLSLYMIVVVGLAMLGGLAG